MILTKTFIRCGFANVIHRVEHPIHVYLFTVSKQKEKRKSISLAFESVSFCFCLLRIHFYVHITNLFFFLSKIVIFAFLKTFPFLLFVKRLWSSRFSTYCMLQSNNSMAVHTPSLTLMQNDCLHSLSDAVKNCSTTCYSIACNVSTEWKSSIIIRK